MHPFPHLGYAPIILNKIQHTVTSHILSYEKKKHALEVEPFHVFARNFKPSHVFACNVTPSHVVVRSKSRHYTFSHAWHHAICLPHTLEDTLLHIFASSSCKSMKMKIAQNKFYLGGKFSNFCSLQNDISFQFWLMNYRDIWNLNIFDLDVIWCSKMLQKKFLAMKLLEFFTSPQQMHLETSNFICKIQRYSKIRLWFH